MAEVQQGQSFNAEQYRRMRKDGVFARAPQEAACQRGMIGTLYEHSAQADLWTEKWIESMPTMQEREISS